MRLLTTLFAITLLATACKPKELPTVVQVDKTNISLRCSHQTTAADLEKFKNLVKAFHKLDFDYSDSSFLPEEGTLKNFVSSISKDGQVIAKCSGGLTSLQYKYMGYQMTVDEDGFSQIKAGQL